MDNPFKHSATKLTQIFLSLVNFIEACADLIRKMVIAHKSQWLYILYIYFYIFIHPGNLANNTSHKDFL